jgi:hypothetical protein
MSMCIRSIDMTITNNMKNIDWNYSLPPLCAHDMSPVCGVHTVDTHGRTPPTNELLCSSSCALAFGNTGTLVVVDVVMFMSNVVVERLATCSPSWSVSRQCTEWPRWLGEVFFPNTLHTYLLSRSSSVMFVAECKTVKVFVTLFTSRSILDVVYISIGV